MFALVCCPLWCFYQAVRTQPDDDDDDEYKRQMSRDFCCPCYYQGWPRRQRRSYSAIDDTCGPLIAIRSCCRHGLVPRQNPVDKSMTLVNRKQIAPQLSCQNFRSLLKTPPSRSWAWYTLYGSFSKPSLITVQNLVVSYSVGVCRDRLTSQMGGCDLPNCWLCGKWLLCNGYQLHGLLCDSYLLRRFLSRVVFLTSF